MNRALTILSMIALIATSAAPARGASELLLQNVVPAGPARYYDHHQGLVLAEGFWAQTGSDVTAGLLPRQEPA
jgi:hypothetical protein